MFKLYAIYLESEDLFAVKDANDKYTFQVPSGKRRLYFGITMQKFEKRVSKHHIRMNDLNYTQSQKLYNCLRCYGFDNFKKIVVLDNLTEEEAKQLEILYIAIYDTYKNGLNSTRGGDSFVLGELNPMASGVKVYNNTTGVITYFTWQGAAAEFLNVSPNQVGLVVCEKSTNNSQLYSPKFDTYFQVKYVDDDTDFIVNMPTPLEKMRKSKSTKIVVVDLDTREEVYFDSIYDASQCLKTKEHNIHSVLHNKKNRQFNAEGKRYDAQKYPKTREWDFDILPTNKLLALARSKKIYYVNDDGNEIHFNSRKDAAETTHGTLSCARQATLITESIKSNGTLKCSSGYYWFLCKN